MQAFDTAMTKLFSDKSKTFKEWQYLPLSGQHLFCITTQYQNQIYTYSYVLNEVTLANATNPDDLKRNVVEFCWNVIKKQIEATPPKKLTKPKVHQVKPAPPTDIAALYKFLNITPSTVIPKAKPMNESSVEETLNHKFLKWVEEKETESDGLDLEEIEDLEEEEEEECPDYPNVAEYVCTPCAELLEEMLVSLGIEVRLDCMSLPSVANKRWNVVVIHYPPSYTWEQIETIAGPVIGLDEADVRRLREDSCQFE